MEIFCDLCGRNFGNRDRYDLVDRQESRTVKTVCEICVENLFTEGIYDPELQIGKETPVSGERRI